MNVLLPKAPSLGISTIQTRVRETLSRYSFHRKRVLLLCEDQTRNAPANVVYPLIEEAVHADSPLEFRVLFATGMHRPLTGSEVSRKLSILPASWQSHDPRLTRNDVNPLVERADVIIGISTTAPHAVAGFSGGAKLLCPGVSSRRLVMYTHQSASSTSIGKSSNGARQFIDNLEAELDREKISLNFVMNDGEPIALCAGTFPDAHKGAVSYSCLYHIQRLPRLDGVIAHVPPRYSDVWQAIKAVYHTQSVVRDHGTLVITGKFSEGLGPLRQYLVSGYAKIMAPLLPYIPSWVHPSLAASQRMIRGVTDRINVYICSDELHGCEWKFLRRFHVYRMCAGEIEQMRTQPHYELHDAINRALLAKENAQ